MELFNAVGNAVSVWVMPSMVRFDGVAVSRESKLVKFYVNF